eukprot:4810999-Pleurochrysis_carterae.AAC.2
MKSDCTLFTALRHTPWLTTNLKISVRMERTSSSSHPPYIHARMRSWSCMMARRCCVCRSGLAQRYGRGSRGGDDELSVVSACTQLIVH